MIPFFFFDLFDAGQIKSSAKPTHQFKPRGISIKRNAIDQIQYVDDVVVEKPKKLKKKQNEIKPIDAGFKLKPYANLFISSLKDSHLKLDGIIKEIARKAKIQKEIDDKSKIYALNKQLEIKEKIRLQDEEDEQVLMMMFEMI